MTNDELLSGFLDRSLSEDQLLELEARRAADPALNNEVRELLAIEDALLVAAPAAVIPTDFLARVEDAIAANVTAGSAPATAVVSTTFKVAAAAIATIGTAVGLYVATQTSNAPAPVVQPTPAVPSVSAPVTPAPAPPAAAIATQSQTPVTAQAVVRTTDDEPSADGAATAYASASVSTIERLVAQYDGCKRNGDNMRCAQLALNIGAQYRKQSDNAMATSYYTDALRIATTLHVVQYEVEALGNLGLLQLERGNNNAAATYLRSAIERAATVDGINVDTYRRALNGLE